MILTQEDFSNILQDIEEWKSYDELSKKYNVSYQCLAQRVYRNKVKWMPIMPKKMLKISILKELHLKWYLNYEWKEYLFNLLLTPDYEKNTLKTRNAG